MDIDNLKYFKKFSNLQKIINERTEGIWVGIFVPNFQTENILIEKSISLIRKLKHLKIARKKHF